MTLPPALPGDFVLALLLPTRPYVDFRLYYRIFLSERSVATKSQRKATRIHRRRAAARGLVRVEVQAAKKDASLIRALAETLRDKPERAAALRSTLASALLNPDIRTAFDIFGSELPDDAFEGVFDRPRRDGWREVDL
jgi:hypothetical protein